MNLKIIGTALLLAAIPAAVLVAQNVMPPADATAKSEAREKYRAACAVDVEKFCADVERGKGKGSGMRTCLASHETQLSTGCKAARDERAAARAKEKS